jgi:hypothetical protein
MDNNRNDLKLLGEVLLQIRGIAGDAGRLGHVSALGQGYVTAQEALAAIYKLADAAHNIPVALADGPGQGAHFLLPGARDQVAAVRVELFGGKTTF